MALGVDIGQCQGNPFGRPTLAQKVAHHMKEHAVAVKLVGGTAPRTPLLGAGTRGGAGVACWLGIASKLSADGASGSAHGQCHLTYAEILLDQTGQRHTVLRLELLIPSGRTALHLLTLLGGRCCTSDLNPPLNPPCTPNVSTLG